MQLSRREATMGAKRTYLRTIFVILLITLFTLSIPGIASADDVLKLPGVKKVTLKNGMTILLIERPGIPIISFNFIIKAGSVSDPAGKEGLASLTAELLRK